MSEKKYSKIEMINVLNPGHKDGLEKKSMTLLQALEAELRNTPYDQYLALSKIPGSTITAEEVERLRLKQEFIQEAINQLKVQGET